MGALKRQFRFRLKSEINKCNQDKTKNFAGLLKSLIAAKKVTNAEVSINATGQPIQIFLSSNYRQKNLHTVDLWTEYVKKNFDVKESVVKNDGDGDDDSDEESDNDEEG